MPPLTRYAAKLLFQFRVDIAGDSGKRRICEERIINFEARSHLDALRRANKRGNGSTLFYQNTDGNKVSFEFVGIMDLMTLGVESEADEVWYDIRERHTPMERRSKILPTRAALLKRLRQSG